MRRTTRRRINQLVSSRESSRDFLRMFVFVAAVVAFAVTVVCIQSGVAATSEQRVLDCHYAGTAAHTHDKNCYDASSNLVCTLPEREIHVHTDDCYTETYELVCGQDETEGHQHTDACYDEAGTLVCGLEESEGHQHSDACYEVSRVLTCGKDEVTETHVHGTGCFKTVETKDEKPADEGTSVAGVVTETGEMEFSALLKRVNENGDEEVVLTVGVKAPKDTFAAGTVMRLKEVDPDEADKVEAAVASAVKKSDEDATGLKWLEGVEVRFFAADGQEVEPAKKIEMRISHDRIRDIEEPILARTLDDAAKDKYHKDDDAEVLDKVKLVNQSEDDESTGNENTLKFDTKLPTTYLIVEAEYKEGHVASPPETESSSEAVILTGEAGGVTVNAVAPAGALPEGADIAVTAVVDPSAVRDQVASAVGEDVQVKGMAVVEVGFVDAAGDEVEPEGQMEVSLASGVTAGAEGTALLRLDDEAQVLAEAEAESDDALTFEGNACGTFALVGTETITTKVITASGETYEISVTYEPEAGIPEGAELQATEILAGTQEFDDYASKAAEALGVEAAEDLSFARFFDVNIVVDGAKIEPTAPVEVKICNTDDNSPDDEGLKIVHFADAGTEVIEPAVDASAGATTVTYEQASFSVIGEVSTTKQNGFPTTNGQHVIIFQDGDNYYALKKDMTLTKVRFFNETVSFIGEGTTTTDYINDYLWYVTSGNGANSRGYIRDSYGGSINLDPANEAMVSGSQRQLTIRDGKLYCSGKLPGSSDNSQVSLSASGGELHRVLLTDSTASPVYFAEASSFDANNNETDLFTQEEVESIIAHWQSQMTQEMLVDKTAEVHDYDNRVYRVDVTASSADYEISPSIALEFVVDASRSMFFPTSLDEVGTFNGGNAEGVRSWINAHGDRNQVYFVIQDKNGSATQYAIFYESNEWKYVDASVYNPPDDRANGGTTNTRWDGSALSGWGVSNLDDGKIYTTAITGTSTRDNVTRKTWVSRIQYLKQCVRVAAQVVYAVDEDAQIGLIGFNQFITDYETYGKSEQETFFSKLDNISLAGGTNSEGGLEQAIKKYDRNNTEYFNEHYAGRKHVVVLVTDGAPNHEYGPHPRYGYDDSYDPTRTNPDPHVVTWETIGRTANRLRGLKDDFDKPTELYTMGLSLANVGTNQQGLFSIATDESYRYAAEDAAQIINAVTKMVKGIFVQANLIGDVKDVIDPAFYPVDKATGKALNEGDWINLDGEKVNAGASDAVGQVSKDATTSNWVVEWKEQSIDWPTKDGEGHVVSPGWHGTVFVKAKEDFLGGNGISTNAEGSTIEASKYRIQGSDNDDIVPLPEGAQNTATLDTPYVNVDELGLTRNDTEWTVYLGTEVDPLTEVKALWDKIKVIEVVTKTDDQHRVSDDGALKYAYNAASPSTSDAAPVAGDEEFLLSSIVTLTNADWTTLLSSNDAIVTKYYSAYGHTSVGTITIRLMQDTVAGEKDLTESPHPTEVVGEAVEKYTLSVRYNPAGANVSDWHTGSYGSEQAGSRAARVDSVNTHTINVYVKGLQITKVDLEDNPLPGAKFGLYRSARDGETDEDKLTTIDGKRYYQVAELDTSANGIAVKEQIEQLNEGEQYYLVETQVPDGYTSIGPIAVTLNFIDVYTPKPGTTTQSTKPASGIYDWQQTAVLTLDASTGVKRTNADNTEDLTHAGIEADVVNDIVYYRVPNTPGAELPAAGGSGIKDLYATGIAMIAGALAYLLVRKKKIQA